DGRIALIGGSGDANGAGAAWIFTRSGSAWSQLDSKLTPAGESAPRAFGRSVALSADGRTAAIAGIGDDTAGATWIFTRSGSAWTQQGPKLAANDEIDTGSCGGGVALSANGDTALIGAENDNNSIGAAWIFTRAASSWRQSGRKLTAIGETGNAYFGKTVA